jgi:alanine racemase
MQLRKEGDDLDVFYRPTWVEISMDALKYNLQAFRLALPADMHIMSVVKADAYGHGAVEVSKEAIACGAAYIAVAFLDEGLELRRAGITAPILVLGYTPPEGLSIAYEQQITVTIYSLEVLNALSEMEQAQSHKLKVHIKLDTGMGRLGLHTERDAIAFIEKALALPNLHVEGLYTHFANADETDKAYTLEQYNKLQRIVDYFERAGTRFDYVHAGNSAVALDTPEWTYNMVRLGISMYGLYPSDEVNHSRINLKPVLSMKTGVVHSKMLPPGTGISYGTIYKTSGDEQIATLPIGYADGYSRMLTGKGRALIHGRSVPIVGRICMDQCMIDVTGIPDIQLGDEVVLIGEQGGERITVEDVASSLGTINYEITCMISHRVPRVYIRDGVRVQAVNPLLRPFS